MTTLLTILFALLVFIVGGAALAYYLSNFRYEECDNDIYEECDDDC